MDSTSIQGFWTKKRFDLIDMLCIVGILPGVMIALIMLFG